MRRSISHQWRIENIGHDQEKPGNPAMPGFT
jgi:hypothetical protein